MLEQGGVWDNHLPLVEFTYNNSFHASIGMSGGVELRCVGMSRARVLCLDLRLCSRRHKRVRGFRRR